MSEGLGLVSGGVMVVGLFIGGPISEAGQWLLGVGGLLVVLAIGLELWAQLRDSKHY